MTKETCGGTTVNLCYVRYINEQKPLWTNLGGTFITSQFRLMRRALKGCSTGRQVKGIAVDYSSDMFDRTSPQWHHVFLIGPFFLADVPQS